MHISKILISLCCTHTLNKEKKGGERVVKQKPFGRRREERRRVERGGGRKGRKRRRRGRRREGSRAVL